MTIPDSLLAFKEPEIKLISSTENLLGRTIRFGE